MHAKPTTPPSTWRRTSQVLLVAVVLLGVAALLVVATSSSAAVQKTTLRQSTEALLKVGIPGAVVVTRKPGNVARIAAGVDLAATRRPMLAGDRFRVGSLTKTFTATLVLQLAEEHRISLVWVPKTRLHRESACRVSSAPDR